MTPGACTDHGASSAAPRPTDHLSLAGKSTAAFQKRCILNSTVTRKCERAGMKAEGTQAALKLVQRFRRTTKQLRWLEARVARPRPHDDPHHPGARNPAPTTAAAGIDATVGSARLRRPWWTSGTYRRMEELSGQAAGLYRQTGSRVSKQWRGFKPFHCRLPGAWPVLPPPQGVFIGYWFRIKLVRRSTPGGIRIRLVHC